MMTDAMMQMEQQQQHQRPTTARKTVLIPVTNIVSAPEGMIQELSFAGNHHIMEDLQTLRVFLRSAPFRTIQTLNLSSCRLGDAGLHALVEALAEGAAQCYPSPALEKLDLSDNQITSEALVSDLSRLIKLLPRLKELNLTSADTTTNLDILEDDDKTRRFVHAHFQNTSTLLEKLLLSSADADALFVVEYAVTTTLERNRILLQAAQKKKQQQQQQKQQSSSSSSSQPSQQPAPPQQQPEPQSQSQHQ